MHIYTSVGVVSIFIGCFHFKNTHTCLQSDNIPTELTVEVCAIFGDIVRFASRKSVIYDGTKYLCCFTTQMPEPEETLTQ